MDLDMMKNAGDAAYRNEMLAGICILIFFIAIDMTATFILLYNMIKVVRVPKVEANLIDCGQIVDGIAIKFTRFGIGSSTSGSTAFRREGKAAYKIKYEYKYGGKTIVKRSPAYFSASDVKLIEKNKNRVKIAVLGNKSCIVGVAIDTQNQKTKSTDD